MIAATRHGGAVSLVLLVSVFAAPVHADEKARYQTEKDVPYRDEASPGWDASMKERCVLDVYHPVAAKQFATVAWFHGGGLRGGGKSVPHDEGREARGHRTA
jgi:acetyl esterase/lipase